jgi:hypothetical protein
MTCRVGVRGNSAVLDQRARSRCSCSIDIQRSNPIAGVALLPTDLPATESSLGMK